MSQTKQTIIVDSHTHLWESVNQLGRCNSSLKLKSNPSISRLVSSYDLIISSEPVNISFLLGFRSKLLNVDIPNKFIADCAYQYRGKILGFGGIDPLFDNITEQVDLIRTNYNLAGFVISPSAQGFHPSAPDALKLYDYAQEYNMPIIIHYGQPFGLPKPEFADPLLWSEIVQQYSSLKFVFTDIAWPFSDKLLLLLAEYENVYTDLAGLVIRQWTTYQTLIVADQMGVLDKFFLASDFPASNSSAAIEALYNINQFASNTNLPTIARQKLKSIVERNVIEILNLQNKILVSGEER